MQTIDYKPSEIRAGARIAHERGGLTVERVIFRLGRGLELVTRSADGYSGPVIYPHPDEPVAVLYMPPLSDDDAWSLRVSTSDFPWAEIVR